MFIALGIMAIVLGAEFLMIDSATFHGAGGVAENPEALIDPLLAQDEQPKIFRPKDWMPWALLSGGVITVIYSYLIPVRYQRWRQVGG